MLQHNLSQEYQTATHSFQQSKAVNHNDNQREFQFDIQEKLAQFEDLILDATRIPLTELIVLDEANILEHLDAIKVNLPPELASAVEILHQKRKIISEAEDYARRLVRLAEERATAIIQESAIISQAKLEAAKITSETQQQCDRLRQDTEAEIAQWRKNAIAECQEIQVGADRYADGVLGSVEQQCQEILTIIQNGRQQLNGD